MLTMRVKKYEVSFEWTSTDEWLLIPSVQSSTLNGDEAAFCGYTRVIYIDWLKLQITIIRMV